jgi:methyltransferase-like protein/trans-aconitate methyltransferase
VGLLSENSPFLEAIMPDQPATSYDEVCYPGYPLPQTHPDRLATLATLFGMTPAPVAACRVLELGCGDGGNLIPMAFTLPDSRFVGIDLSGQAIAQGQEAVAALKLENIQFRQGDVLEVSPALGEFDYIIAHGLYSWVPAAVRDKTLAVCRENLAPHGVAYVSYNTFPGCHQRHLLRDMMLFHVQPFAEPGRKVAEALAFARSLAAAQAEEDPYAGFVRDEVKRLTEYQHWLLYHDDLAEINVPVYFHQFMEQAARHGLQFLAEADYFEMQDHIYPPEVTAQLRQLAAGDVVAREQYLDFLKFRKFRQTLLCHQQVALDRQLRPELLERFYLASPARPVVDRPDLGSEEELEFRGPRGSALSTNVPLAKAAVWTLGSLWPLPMPWGELVRRAQSLLGQGPVTPQKEAAADVLVMAEALLAIYSAGLVQLHLERPPFVLEVSERPVASPLARWQVASGEPLITNLRHTAIEIEDKLARALLLLLDGTRDGAALLGELTELVTSGAAPLLEGGQPVTDPGRVAQMLAQGLEPNLARLGRLALLVK